MSEVLREARPAGTGLFVAYVVAFHLVWAVWPFVLYPRLTAALGETTLAYAVVQLSIRAAIWLLPVWVYLRVVDGVDPLEYLALRHRVGTGFMVAIVLTALNVAGTMARFGPPHFSPSRVTWNSVLGTSFFVGFIEEIPYRGFMLQKLTERVGFWTANVLSSLLFVAIHVPGWMALRTLSVGNAAFVFIFGAIMATAFRASGSLWAPIASHSANDFLSFVVFGR